jgi:Ti-type conjugative transfer relaxase TraA
MAIMHLSAKNGARGKGAAHAQYIERQGKYSNKLDFLTSESGNMPAWAQDDSLVFWKAADKYERENGRSYKELEVSLPRELTDEQQIELVREFTKNILGDKHAYTWAIHQPKAQDGELNPHVHLMFTERAYDGIERKKTQFFKRYNPNNPEIGGAKKERYFGSKQFVYGVRQEWAETVNHRLKELEIDARIDHRSYKDMNIDLESQNIKRVFANSANVEQVAAFTMSGNIRDKQKANGARIIENPQIALDALTAMQSTFSKRELEKFVFNHTDGLEQYTQAYNSVIAYSGLQMLDDEKHKFTSDDLIKIEREIVAQVERANVATIDNNRSVTEKLQFSNVANKKTFNDEQKTAYNVLTSNAQIAVVNGAAGTGKSYVLAAINEGYTDAGYKVIGAALQGTTAQNMERDAGIKSQTIASLLMRIERENANPNAEKTLTPKTILVIDEAGMVGSRDMQKLIEYVQSSGASIRMVGDTYQLNAVAAGGALAQVQNNLNPENQTKLVKIIRQRDEQMRDASIALSNHNIADGLTTYRDMGKTHEFETQQGARDWTVAQWAASDKDKIMLAYTNADVNAMNTAARVILRERGALGEDVRASTDKGFLSLAQGDEIIFRKPNKDLGVLNGTRGTVEQVKAADGLAESLQIRLKDDGQVVSVDLSQYNSLNHAYASTIHTSQGVTVDESFMLVSGAMNANLTYVGATRHRDDIAVAYSREQFKDFNDMTRQLSNAETKTFTADFNVADERLKSLEKIAERETLADRMEQHKSMKKAKIWVSSRKPATLEQTDTTNQAKTREKAQAHQAKADQRKGEIERIQSLDKSEPARNYSMDERVEMMKQMQRERGVVKDARKVGGEMLGVGSSAKVSDEYAKKEGVFKTTKIEQGAEIEIKAFVTRPDKSEYIVAEIVRGRDAGADVELDLSKLRLSKSDRYEEHLKTSPKAMNEVTEELNKREISLNQKAMNAELKQRDVELKILESSRQRSMQEQPKMSFRATEAADNTQAHIRHANANRTAKINAQRAHELRPDTQDEALKRQGIEKLQAKIDGYTAQANGIRKAFKQSGKSLQSPERDAAAAKVKKLENERKQWETIRDTSVATLEKSRARTVEQMKEDALKKSKGHALKFKSK